MKLLNKLKNALFEEEYVEVEEELPKEKKKHEHKDKKPMIKEIDKIRKLGKERAMEEPVEEKPIVKKIVTPTPKTEEKPENIDTLEEDVIEDREILKGNSDFKFPDILEDDFAYEKKNYVVESKPQVAEERPLYKGTNKKTNKYEFETNNDTKSEYGAYEKKQLKKEFKPSPIISPIYGVLDKNYQKEEVVNKKEIRLPSFSSERLSVDEVRARAYGIKEDKTMFEVSEVTKEEEPIAPADDLLDLTDDTTTPVVSKVTVGDAEEYFQDLGLEYNNDYIDSSKSKATSRRVVENKEMSEKIEAENNDKTKTKSDDENLFDLIDSMYNKE